MDMAFGKVEIHLMDSESEPLDFIGMSERVELSFKPICPFDMFTDFARWLEWEKLVHLGNLSPFMATTVMTTRIPDYVMRESESMANYSSLKSQSILFAPTGNDGTLIGVDLADTNQMSRLAYDEFLNREKSSIEPGGKL